ncbi:MAG: PKD domain-containing protein [Methanobacteriota archaeon]
MTVRRRTRGGKGPRAAWALLLLLLLPTFFPLASGTHGTGCPDDAAPTKKKAVAEGCGGIDGAEGLESEAAVETFDFIADSTGDRDPLAHLEPYLLSLMGATLRFGGVGVDRGSAAVRYAADDVAPASGVTAPACCSTTSVALSYPFLDCRTDLLPQDARFCNTRHADLQNATIYVVPPRGPVRILAEPDHDGAAAWTFAPSDPEGGWGFYAVLVDQAGNVESAPGPETGTTVNGTAVDTRVILDRSSPFSFVRPLPAWNATGAVPVSWQGSDPFPSGTDDTSGVATFEVRVRSSGNGTTWTWLSGTSATSATFPAGALAPATPGTTFSFFSIATDGAGTREDPAKAFEASITVDLVDPVVVVDAVGTIPATTRTIRFNVTEANLAGITCDLDSTGPASCDALDRHTVSGLPEGAHSFRVNASDFSGRTGSASISFRIDLTAPIVTIDPVAAFAPAAPVISFSVADDNPSTSACALDGDASVSCTSPWTPPATTETLHTVEVRHTDAAGRAGSASTSFTLDLTDPIVTLADLAGAVLATVPPLAFEVLETNPGTTACLLDGVAQTPCASPSWTPVVGTDGPHVARVVHTDRAGRAANDTSSFVLDTVAPSLALAAPAEGAFLASPTVVLDIDLVEANPDTLTCALDAAGAAACASDEAHTFAGVPDGAHVATVVARDDAGHETTRTRGFVVDTNPPSLTIATPLEGAYLASGTVVVSFALAEANLAALTCALDAGAAVPCASTSGHTFTGVSEGAHQARLVATDRALHETVRTRTFVVDTILPTVTITYPAEDDDLVPGPDVEATFVADGTGTPLAAIECSLDGGAFGPCASGDALSFEKEGDHALSVRVRDSAGLQASDERSFRTAIPGKAIRLDFEDPPTATDADTPVAFEAVPYDAFDEPTDDTVTYEVAAGSGTIDEDGLFVPLGTGPVEILARSGTLEARATILVAPGEPARVVVSPSAAKVLPGRSVPFTARTEDANGNTIPGSTFSWSVGDGAVGEVDAGGRFRASAVGTTTVRARDLVAGLSGTATVTVESQASAVTAIVLSPAGATVPADRTESFVATPLDRDGAVVAGVEVAYSVSNVSVGFISRTGVFAPTRIGTTEVVARVGAVEARVSVTVVAGALSVLAVSPDAAAVGPGGALQFAAAGRDVRNNLVPVSGTVWSVSGPGTIDTGTGAFVAGAEPGVVHVTARAGDAVGTALVTIVVERVAAGETREVSASVRSETVRGVESASLVAGLAEVASDATILLTAGPAPGAAIAGASVRFESSATNTAIAVEAQGGSLDVTPEEVDAGDLAALIAGAETIEVPALFLTIGASTDGRALGEADLNRLLAEVSIDFRVPAALVRAAGVDPGRVRLVEYSEGRRVRSDVPATLLGALPEEDAFEYRAVLTGFSSFAVIISTPPPPPPTPRAEPDRTPPRTTVEVIPLGDPRRADAPLDPPVALRFRASDSGSGLRQTFHRVTRDGVEYYARGSEPEIVLWADGLYRVEFGSVDWAENSEPTRILTLRLAESVGGAAPAGPSSESRSASSSSTAASAGVATPVGAAAAEADRVAPTGRIVVTGEGGGGWFADIATVAVEAEDERAGAVSARYRVCDGDLCSSFRTVSGPFVLEQGGVFRLEVELTDASGNRRTLVEFIGIDREAPVARASRSVRVGTVGVAVGFDARGSTDDGGLARIAWDFGDGTTGSGAVAEHAFPRAGTFTVAVTVTDEVGRSRTLRFDVPVEAARTASDPLERTSTEAPPATDDAAGPTVFLLLSEPIAGRDAVAPGAPVEVSVELVGGAREVTWFVTREGQQVEEVTLRPSADGLWRGTFRPDSTGRFGGEVEVVTASGATLRDDVPTFDVAPVAEDTPRLPGFGTAILVLAVGALAAFLRRRRL